MSSDTLIQWTQVKGLSRAHLDDLLEERRTAKEALESVKGALDAINLKILNALASVEVKTVAVGEIRVTLVPGGKTEKLDKKKLWTRLLELGVKEKVVRKAYEDSTTVDDRAAYVLVTEPKEGKDAA